LSCEDILALPYDLIERVVFARRQDVRSDPVVCEVHSLGVVYHATQDDKRWIEMLERLEAMDGFMADWRTRVSEPPFTRIEMVAYDNPRPPMIEDQGD
jgi:hypothetical protein